MRIQSLALIVFTLAQLTSAYADPVITSPPPANGASPSGPFVFVFSEPMNVAASGVDFYVLSPFTPLTTTEVWSSGNTVLTCTPSPAFPSNQQIVWSAYGENVSGDPLSSTNSGGIFTTGSGSGGGGGFGTNAITTFSVGKVHHYNQTSSGAPTLDPATPYGFSGVTSLSSNRTATSITLTLPGGSVSNLTQLPFQPEIWLISPTTTSLSAFDSGFQSGNYSFFVQAATSNQTVIVNLPITNTMPQPNAPHLTNYTAGQSINPSQPFVLGWDAFTGGTTADYIDVDIGTAYYSPNPNQPGALNGTARTFTIPAGVLQANSNYFSRVGFFRFSGATNSTQATAAYRATYTEFNLTTGSDGQLRLINPGWSPGLFSFDVQCTNGQTVTVEYTNVVTAPSPWPKLMTTNSAGSQFHVVSPQAVSNKFLFYRARNGP